MPEEILHPRQVQARALGLGLGGIGLRLDLLHGLVGRVDARLGKRQVGRGRGSGERQIRRRRALVRFGGREVRPGLGQRCLEVAGVDLDQELAGHDVFVVGDVQRRYPAADLRSHRDHVAVDERVIGRDLAEGEPPVSGTAASQGQQAAGDCEPDSQVPMPCRRHWLRCRGTARAAAIQVALGNDDFCHGCRTLELGDYVREKRNRADASFENARPTMPGGDLDRVHAD